MKGKGREGKGRRKEGRKRARERESDQCGTAVSE